MEVSTHAYSAKELLFPIEDGNQIGRDPRTSPMGQVIYRSLRDARSQARADERQQEASGAHGTALNLSSAWTDVRNLAQKLLQEAAKDLEVLAWLIEAETRLNGFAGLADSLTLTVEVVQIFGPDLHPHPEEPDDDPYAAIAGLNGIGREGALIQPLRLIPLVPDAQWGQFCLWDILRGEEDALQNKMEAVGVMEMQTQLEHAMNAARTLERLNVTLSEALGAKAPSLGHIAETVDSAIRGIRRLAGLTTNSTQFADDSSAERENAQTVAVPTEQISSREEAFEALLRISAYFRKTEPHSPISYAIETIVRRGEMDFLTLIRELIPDDNTRENVMTTAGIRNVSDEKTPPKDAP